MISNKIWLFIFLSGILFITGCSYRKGEAYYFIQSGDSIRFIVRKSASGEKILGQISNLRDLHTNRNDEYKIVYLCDSLEIVQHRAVLLSHSEMPDYENDLLTKGYLGAFGTKEIVTYMVVTTEKFDQYFAPPEER